MESPPQRSPSLIIKLYWEHTFIQIRYFCLFCLHKLLWMSLGLRFMHKTLKLWLPKYDMIVMRWLSDYYQYIVLKCTISTKYHDCVRWVRVDLSLIPRSHVYGSDRQRLPGVRLVQATVVYHVQRHFTVLSISRNRINKIVFSIIQKTLTIILPIDFAILGTRPHIKTEINSTTILCFFLYEKMFCEKCLPTII